MNAIDHRTITDRDFLLGSVWEGTGEELHTNRYAAARAMYGQRVLSGISGMLVALHTHDPALLWTRQDVEWSFDGPIFEGATVRIESGAVTGGRCFHLSQDDSLRGRGRVGVAGAPGHPPEDGRISRGRTMTGADTGLLAHWLPPVDAPSPGSVPWPVLLLTASGLVVRDKLPGAFELVLNRWLRWTQLADVRADDTVHCIVGLPAVRPSRTRPDLSVTRLEVHMIDSVSNKPVGHIDWVMVCR
ncbi:hypothetical protein D5S18_26925 [Nocardia panacis]|uniref:MaoC-like domain-containing protein n=1 Tax=Nocardia panacis TaxID=2340916 RepID=A0A3A4KMQ7_9NOCA|nr:hypothetical protein [Nocardia panacis]RJO70826.1 hypothetical protein D5S18_26925 [Nocardia panacis]